MATAIFRRKAVDISELKTKSDLVRYGNQYVIEKVIELEQAEYDEFANNLLDYYDFIEENKALMFVDTNDVWHCILVKAKDALDGICIEAEGYGFAKYTFYLPMIL